MSDEMDKPDPEPELVKPDPSIALWATAALDVPMTLSDIEDVKMAFREAEMEIPENLSAALNRAENGLSFIRALTEGAYRACGP